jgi:hypothetical protein
MPNRSLTIDTVKRCFENAATSFAPNELAYLALTSKVELPLRDRLAWSLHTELWPDHVVAREWRRTDLAVVDRGLPPAPVVLLEAKAMYSFDGCTERGWAQYEGYLRADHAKASALAAPDTSIYLLLLATHPEGTFDADLREVVKYSSGIGGAARRFPEPGAVRSACSARVTPALQAYGHTVSGSLAAGTCFDLDVTIDYWVVQP